MSRESSRRSPGERRMSDADGVQGGGPLTAGEDAHLRAARVAQRLWGAGLACEIVNLVPAPTAVLRRDRGLSFFTAEPKHEGQVCSICGADRRGA